MRTASSLLLLIAAPLLLVTLRADSRPPILTDPTVARMSLEAPLNELISESDRKGDPHVTGRLTLQQGDRSITLEAVTVSLRGHTSLKASECDFPKLKLDLSKSARAGTPFEGVKALKIGTHCGDRPDSELTPRYGRLANEHEPLREALVYRILHAVGVTTLLARPARITYIDSGGTRPPLERNALLLEDDDEAGRRLDAVRMIDEKSFESASSQFAEPDTARLLFAEAMIGNFDWCLRVTDTDTYRCDARHPLWNVLAIHRQSPPDIPLIYDFDLAGPVVGRHVWFDQVFDPAFAVPPSAVTVEVQAQVQRTRSVFGRTALDTTRAAFLKARPAVFELIDGAPVDEEGRRFARAYVSAFYDAIADSAFYSPVVVTEGKTAFTDLDAKRPVCGERSIVPGGTPVSAPLETRGDMVRVRLLDALWEWTGDHRCDAVHREPVWMPASAIGTDYPR